LKTQFANAQFANINGTGTISRLRRACWVASLFVPAMLATAVAQQPSPDLTPLPPAAIGPQVPKDKGYIVQEVRDGLYWVGDGSYTAMFLVYDTGVIAVDAPRTIGKKYLSAIADVTSKPITHVIYSHEHSDHIGSADMFPKSAIIIAQEETANFLKRYQDPHRPIPQVTFKDHYVLNVGGQELDLDYHGPIHVAGNTFVYAPKQKVLMLVDVAFPGWIPYKNLAESQDIPEYVRGYDVALSYDFNTYIGGHVTRPGTRDDVIVGREFILDLKRAARAAASAVSFQEVAKTVTNPNRWSLVDAYRNAQTQKCVEDMLPRWRNRLGGVETFLPSQCDTMVEALNIDFGPN
jgi:glyoxylase-like metal-dependent hydrolase (beta-lactamase superfamily II)